jgi:hypothetical protein
MSFENESEDIWFIQFGAISITVADSLGKLT